MVRCNCERCSFIGKCDWAATFEVLQFGRTPATKCLLLDEGYKWSDKVARTIKGTKRANIDVCKTGLWGIDTRQAVQTRTYVIMIQMFDMIILQNNNLIMCLGNLIDYEVWLC